MLADKRPAVDQLTAGSWPTEGCQLTNRQPTALSLNKGPYLFVEVARSRVEGPRSRVEGPRSRVEVPRSRVEGPRSRVEGINFSFFSNTVYIIKCK